MSLRAAELEVLITADTAQVEAAEKRIKKTGQDVEKNPIKVGADAKPALASMERVEEAAKKIVSAKTVATVDANIERAEKAFMRAKERLDYLRSVETELDVKADIGRAEANLQKVMRQMEGLRKARAVMEVDADTVEAEKALDEVADKAEDAGGDGGKRSGNALAGGIIGALAAIPVANIVAGVIEQVNDGFEAALGQEVTRDRLQGLTGISEEDAMRLSRAAGEAYANVFGESIEANMDTTRLALQFRILDPDATTRDAQKTIQALAGLSDVLGEDVRPIAATVATLLRSGVVKSAEEAYDLIATGAREGVNRNEDLLDTLTEYPALFKRLGLSGPEALGLINQGLNAGARNSDLAADALKEFQIRATDGSDASAEAFRQLGFDAEDMTAKIARGGDEAREGLDAVLDRLRETEDPVLRNAAAVGLFGTQAEDLGAALFAMDLSTAVEQLDGVTGSAQKMFDTLADNDATKMEQAQRNVEVAMQGIQGALATALSEPLGDAADWVSQNRGPLLQFFSDLVNGAIDFGIGATESFGAFVSGPLAETIDGLVALIDFMNGAFEGPPKELSDLADSMRNFDDTTDGAVDTLEGMRDKFNGFADGQIALGYLNDAALRTAESIGAVGVSTDGATVSQEQLEEQVRNALTAMDEEIAKASEAGESQDNLAERYRTSTDALVGQLEQMGLTKEEAQALIDTVKQTPEQVTTTFNAETATAFERIAALQAMARELTGDRTLRIATGPGGAGGEVLGSGAVLEYMALGGLTPMQPVAQMVPANTWRVVGDRSDVAEAFIPIDGSPRSLAILAETMRRMGVTAMAEGGIVASTSAAGMPVVQFGDIRIEGTNMSPAELIAIITRVVRDVFREQFGNRGGL